MWSVGGGRPPLIIPISAMAGMSRPWVEEEGDPGAALGWAQLR